MHCHYRTSCGVHHEHYCYYKALLYWNTATLSFKLWGRGGGDNDRTCIPTNLHQVELLQGLYRAKRRAEGGRLLQSGDAGVVRNLGEEAGGETETGREGETGGETRAAARLLEAQAIDKELNASGSATKYPVEGCD